MYFTGIGQHGLRESINRNAVMVHVKHMWLMLFTSNASSTKCSFCTEVFAVAQVGVILCTNYDVVLTDDVCLQVSLMNCSL